LSQPVIRGSRLVLGLDCFTNLENNKTIKFLSVTNDRESCCFPSILPSGRLTAHAWTHPAWGGHLLQCSLCQPNVYHLYGSRRGPKSCF